MASFTMLPNGVTGTNNWLNFGGATADHTLVDDDTDSSSYIYENTLNGEITFTLANPSVSEGDIDTINSVTVKVKGHHTGLGNKNLQVEQTGSGISNGSDTHSIARNTSYPTYTGAAEQYYTGESVWTYAKLEDLQVKLTLLQATASFRFTVRVSYIEVIVDYDEAGEEAVVYNATIFGTNF